MRWKKWVSVIVATLVAAASLTPVSVGFVGRAFGKCQ